MEDGELRMVVQIVLVLVLVLDFCGGSLPRRSAAKTGAQRRHRFSIENIAFKAAWCFL
jgi:hypothetical protein